ncbi:GTPase Der [uncultured archaeon]|nr:GTPase Der [uncultured archaeon]
MKQGFMNHVLTLIKASDIVIEILDARHPEKTRNIQLEKMTTERGKKLVLVINKADLIEDKKEMEKKKAEIAAESGAKTIFISALKRDGINMIRKEIGMESSGKDFFTIGIIGYPNVGKSTLINALAGKGRGRVATSRKAGLTRGLQNIKISEGLYLIDSPGIIPFKEEEFNLFLMESKNPNQLKDPETAAVRLIQVLGKEKIAKFFSLELTKEKIEEMDEEEILEAVALKRNMVIKGGLADVSKAGRDILERYQKHELK